MSSKNQGGKPKPDRNLQRRARTRAEREGIPYQQAIAIERELEGSEKLSAAEVMSELRESIKRRYPDRNELIKALKRKAIEIADPAIQGDWDRLVLVCEAHDLELDPESFSDSERAQVIAAWDYGLEIQAEPATPDQQWDEIEKLMARLGDVDPARLASFEAEWDFALAVIANGAIGELADDEPAKMIIQLRELTSEDRLESTEGTAPGSAPESVRRPVTPEQLVAQVREGEAPAIARRLIGEELRGREPGNCHGLRDPGRAISDYLDLLAAQSPFRDWNQSMQLIMNENAEDALAIRLLTCLAYARYRDQAARQRLPWPSLPDLVRCERPLPAGPVMTPILWRYFDEDPLPEALVDQAMEAIKAALPSEEASKLPPADDDLREWVYELIDAGAATLHHWAGNPRYQLS